MFSDSLNYASKTNSDIHFRSTFQITKTTYHAEYLLLNQMASKL